MGMDLSFMSMVGVMALAGVVVNNAIILIDFVNKARASGLGVGRAIVTCGPLRLRAIFLTTVTTFAGLAPIVFERSMQAQFLIPMAVSLAFGLVFGTAITLLILPVAYVILEDVRKLGSAEARKPGSTEV
jgi:multidrug efflux pump subunit AcrB